MLNKTKFLSSAVLSLAMLASESGITAVNAAEMATITIEGEANPIMDPSYMVWTADTPANTAEYSGGKYGNIRTASGTAFDSGKAVFSYNFTVESAGEYKLSLGSSKPNAVSDYASFAISVDGGAFVEVTGANKNGGIDGDTIFSIYSLSDSYVLLEGSHTVTFKMLNNKGRGDGRGFVFLDYVKFTQTSQIPGLTISGNDAYTISNPVVSRYTEQSGSSNYPVFKTGSGVGCPEGGVVVSYKFNAPEDGLYNLTVSANRYDTGLSTYAVSVNDGDYTEIKTASVTSATAIEGNIYTYATNINYELTQGINTINFKILTGRTSDSRVYCFLNYLQLAKVPVTVTEKSADVTEFTKIYGSTDNATVAVFTVTPEYVDGVATAIDSVTVTIEGQDQTKDGLNLSGQATFGIIVNKLIDQSDISITIN